MSFFLKHVGELRIIILRKKVGLDPRTAPELYMSHFLFLKIV
jgi:hypothetical protein